MTSSLVMLLGLSAAAVWSADDHLLAGARHFREARYADALVEFRMAQSLGATEAQGYAAAALVKLDRPEEALEMFDREERSGGDALLRYYHALACYGARLYSRADALLAGLRERAGPRLASQVSELRIRIATELTKEPPTPAIDWYLERCSSRRDEGRVVLAGEYCREAATLASRRSDRYGLAAASGRLAQLENSDRPGAQP